MFEKTSAFAGEYEHYYSEDPALGGEGFDHKKWVETRDVKYLPTRPGASPIKFTLRRLSSREWLYVQDVGSREGGNSGLWMAVALALRGIDPYLDPKGKELEPKVVIEGKLRRLSDADMDRVSDVDDGALLNELGWRIHGEKSHNPLS